METSSLAPHTESATGVRSEEKERSDARQAKALGTLAVLLVFVAEYRYFEAGDGTGADAGSPLGSVPLMEWLELLCFAGAGVYVAFHLLRALNHGRAPGYSKRTARPVRLAVLYAAFMVVTSLYSPTPFITFVTALNLLVVVLLGLLLAFSGLAGRALEHFSRRFVVLTAATAALGLVLPDAGYDRYSWANLGPPAAGTFAALSVIVVGALLTDRRGWSRLNRIVTAAFFVFLSVILLATVARTATVACLAGLTAVALLSARGSRRLVRAVSLISLSALLVYVAFPLLIRYAARGQDTDQLVSLTGRREFWEVNLEFIMERPLFGHGYLASRTIVDRVDVIEFTGSHNALFEALTSGGAFAAIILLTAVAIAFVRLRQKHQGPPPAPTRSLISVGVLVFLVTNGIGSSGLASAPGSQIVWFVMVLAYASSPGSAEVPAATGRPARREDPVTVVSRPDAARRQPASPPPR